MLSPLYHGGVVCLQGEQANVAKKLLAVTGDSLLLFFGTRSAFKSYAAAYIEQHCSAVCQ